MWFLQEDMLLKLLLCTAVFIFGLYAFEKLKIKQHFKIFSALLSAALMFSYSKELGLIYTAYVLLSYAMIVIMRKIKKCRKGFFVVFCILFALPFFAYRITPVKNYFGFTIVLIGFAYNMLKAIDALFYTYYTDEKIEFTDYANFILFFPVFTSGPIFRYRDFHKAFENIKPLTAASMEYGIKRFILGMFKKVVLIALLNMVFEKLTAIEQYHFYQSIATIVLAYLILYLDLSGYSDMAIGIGRLTSMEVPENFKQPWSAASFTQFWRKWHVTLSDWIREHIFVVVQGKRLNKYQSALIGFVTMIVMSLWHEFTLITLIGGIYMGLFLVIENIFSLSTFNVRKEKKYKYVLRCFLVNFFFAVNALTFSLDISKVVDILKGLVR